jgi:hypothetical protein
MENVRNRVHVYLATASTSLNKHTTKSIFSRVQIFNNDLVAVHCKASMVTLSKHVHVGVCILDMHCKASMVTLSKPVHVGVCILNTAKIALYSFHYGFVREVYGERA